MADEVVVLNDVSRCGLHRLHLIGTRPIDLGAAICKYVGDGQVETWLMYEEEALRVHHLRLYWTSPPFPPLVGEGRRKIGGENGSAE